MGRRLLPAAVAALLSAGCVPVSHPVGDVEKAEPDKGLVGKWTAPKKAGPLAALSTFEELVIDVPAVKGNAKGLMRAVPDNAPDGELWFYTATVGKHAYANTIQAPDGKTDETRFGKEGRFAKWKEAEVKRFYVFRYARAGDTLAIDCGNNDTFAKLMKAANVPDDGQKYVPYFLTPSDWFDKSLGKDGADKVFDGSNTVTFKREKK
jgi:hypothetical protein